MVLYVGLTIVELAAFRLFLYVGMFDVVAAMFNTGKSEDRMLSFNLLHFIVTDHIQI